MQLTVQQETCSCDKCILSYIMYVTLHPRHEICVLMINGYKLYIVCYVTSMWYPM